MSDVKAKVIAIVTGQEFVPKELVRLESDEVVVKRQAYLDELVPAIRSGYAFERDGIIPSAEISDTISEILLSDPLQFPVSVEDLPQAFAAPEPNNDATGVSVVDSVEPIEPNKPFIRFGMYGHTDYIQPRVYCGFSSNVAGPLVLPQ